MIAITRDQLRTFAPVGRADFLDALVNAADELDAAGINTPLRLQHFLAQVATETGGLRLLEENLNYSAERLVQVWPKRFPTKAAAAPYARNPQKLANKVYGGRLGNTGPNEGYLYRGSGALQTTGKSNYIAAGYEKNPEALRQPATAITAALTFWTDNGCNAIADRDDVTALRKRINGGDHGLAETKNYLAKAKKIFTHGVATALVPEMPRAQVKALQEQLVALGYVSVGKPDGLIGAMTIGAISAFQAENGLEVNGRFDAATQTQLYEASPRVVVRTEAEPSNSKVLARSRTLQNGSLSLLTVGAADLLADPITTFTGIKGQMAVISELLAPFKDVSTWVGDHWMLIVVALAAVAYFHSRKIEQARLEDHRTGASA